MKKLEEINKKNIFEVPEGYFERLPMQIQAKLEIKPRSWFPVWGYAFKYAMPTLFLAIALLYFIRPKSLAETEQLLAGISNEHLIAYLHETDISESDLLEAANFDDIDADSLNLSVQSQYLFGDSNEKEMKGMLENEL